MKLSLPPSVNAMFRNIAPKSPANRVSSDETPRGRVRGRAKSKSYLAWLRAASMELFQYRPEARRVEKEGGPYAVCIRLPVDHRSDIDNRVKPILDLLVEHRILTDDSQVNALHVYRDRTLDAAQIAIATRYSEAPAITAGLHEQHRERARADVLAWGAFLMPEQVNAALVALGLDREGVGGNE